MADVVDLLEDSPPPAAPAPPTDDQLRQAIKGHLMGKDLSTISLKALRLDLEKGFHLPPGGLDSRKGDIRQLAQDLVIEAQNAPPVPLPLPTAAPATPIEPAAKKRRTLAQALPTAGEAAPVSPVKTKAPKRKAPPSAYSLWSLENRSTVAEDLEKELQRKPTFGEISKAVPERWKAVSQVERATYEEKAKVAKAEQAAGVDMAAKAKPQKAPAESRKGKGKGKGKGKDGEETVMSRAEFFSESPVINCAFQIPGVQATESCMNNLVARMFKSQGVGWFASTKFQIPVGSKEVTVQAQVVMNVSGSKHWEDGEGLEEVMKNLEHRESGAVEAAPAEAATVVPQAAEMPEASPAEAESVPAGSSEVQDAVTDAAEAEPQATATEPDAEKTEDAKLEAAPENATEASEVEQPQPMADVGEKSEEDAKMEDAEIQQSQVDEAMEAPEAPKDEEVAQAADAEAEAEATAGNEDPSPEKSEEVADPVEAEVEPATTEADPDLQEKAVAGGA